MSTDDTDLTVSCIAVLSHTDLTEHTDLQIAALLLSASPNVNYFDIRTKEQVFLHRGVFVSHRLNRTHRLASRCALASPRRAEHCTPLTQHGLTFSQPSKGLVTPSGMCTLGDRTVPLRGGRAKRRGWKVFVKRRQSHSLVPTARAERRA